jgi:hypothetical protein
MFSFHRFHYNLINHLCHSFLSNWLTIRLLVSLLLVTRTFPFIVGHIYFGPYIYTTTCEEVEVPIDKNLLSTINKNAY